MPRKQRYWVPGAMYHIVSRGNRKSDIFFTDDDRIRYLDLLETTRNKYPFQLHAYCLMSNHVHLLLETKSHPPSKVIHYLHSRYAQYLNRTYNLTGHVFQGRFHAEFIYSVEYELTTSRYIHLNPCEAHMVNKPEMYRWSSYRAYFYNERNPHIDTSRTLSHFPFHHFPTYFHFMNAKDVDLVDLLKDNCQPRGQTPS